MDRTRGEMNPEHILKTLENRNDYICKEAYQLIKNLIKENDKLNELLKALTVCLHQEQQWRKERDKCLLTET